MTTPASAEDKLKKAKEDLLGYLPAMITRSSNLDVRDLARLLSRILEIELYGEPKTPPPPQRHHP